MRFKDYFNVLSNISDCLQKNLQKIYSTLAREIYQYFAHPASEKLFPAANGNKYRDPQTDIVQRVSNLVSLRLTQAIYQIIPLRESQKKRQKK